MHTIMVFQSPFVNPTPVLHCIIEAYDYKSPPNAPSHIPQLLPPRTWKVDREIHSSPSAAKFGDEHTRALKI
jgi:hypothetical protein